MVVSNNNGCTATDVIVVNIITSVKTIGDKKLINVYPNPAKDKITLEVSNLPDKDVVMRLYNVEGKLLQKEDVRSVNGLLKKTIPLSGIASGIYFLEIDQYERIKIMVE